MGVKVAVIGGGSTYTPELVEGFVTRGDRLPVDELVLLDIDAERLSVVGALADRMVRKAGWPGTVRLTGNRAEALEGADFVIVQLRVGGQAARYTDETIPLRFGCIGQETTGPGGFAKALRTLPVVLELAEETARRGAAGAWFVDFTNPTGLVTQALLDEGHHALGLCNVAIGFQRRFADRFGVAASTRSAVRSFLVSQGMSVDHVSRAGDVFTVHGSTPSVSKTFHTPIERYSVDGHAFLANTAAPSFPATLPIVNVVGLNTLERYRTTTGSTTAQDLCAQNTCTGATTEKNATSAGGTRAGRPSCWRIQTHSVSMSAMWTSSPRRMMLV